MISVRIPTIRDKSLGRRRVMHVDALDWYSDAPTRCKARMDLHSISYRLSDSILSDDASDCEVT